MSIAKGGPDGFGSDPHRDQPRKASRRVVESRLTRVAMALNFAHEELSELRHELGIAQRSEPKRRKLDPETGR